MTVKEKTWQKFIDNELHDAAMKAINYGLKFVQGVTKGAVDSFNDALANETATTFEFNIQSLIGGE